MAYLLRRVSGRYFELLFLIVVNYKSTDLAVVIPNSTIKRKHSYITARKKQILIFTHYLKRMHSFT